MKDRRKNISKFQKTLKTSIKKAFPLFRLEEEVYIGEGLRVDLYMPDFDLAIEAQGKQHYAYTPHFHGASFSRQLKRDSRKAEILDNQETILLEFRYDEPIEDVKYVKEKILRAIEDISYTHKEIFKTLENE